MLTLPDAWLEQAEQLTLEPIYLVEFDVGSRVVFEVVDGASGGGETATITYDGTPYTITEGADFVAEISNETCAERMALAWLDILPEGVNVFPLGRKIYAVIDRDHLIGSSTSNSAAWTTKISTEQPKFVTGHVPYGDYDAAIAQVGSYGIDIDPIARGVARTGERELQFDDDGPGCVVRTLMSEYPDLAGKVVRLWLGFHEIDEADFVADGVYIIQDAFQPPYTPAINIRMQDVASKLEGTKVRVDVVNRHPLEAVQKILEAAGVPPALYDATTLDPTQYPDIGHVCVSRHSFGLGWTGVDGKSSGVTVGPRGSTGKRNARGVYAFKRTFPERGDFGTIAEPVDALDLLNDLLQLLDGSFAPGDDGVYRFLRYDKNATVVAEISAEEISHFDQTEKWPAAHNHIEVKGPHNLNGNSVLYEVEDRFAQARRATAGGQGQRRTLSVESEWLTGVAFLSGTLPIGAGVGATMQVRHAQANGFSGLRAAAEPQENASPPAFVQDVNTDCTAARPVYLYIFHTTDGRREFVRCDAAAPVEVRASEGLAVWYLADFTVAERGLFGTTAQDWDANNPNPNYSGRVESGQILIADVTLSVNLADRKVDRLAAGLPPVGFRMGLEGFKYQPGDLISVVHPNYFDQGLDGTGQSPFTGNTEVAIFEILRKEPEITGPGPGVNFYAALSHYSTFRPITPWYPPPPPPPPAGQIENEYSLQLDGVDDYVDYGNVTTLDGADSAVWAGWVRILGSLHTGEVVGRATTGNEQFSLQIRGGNIALEIGAGVAETVTVDGPLTLNTWHHVAVIFDGPVTKNVQIYLDGALVPSITTGVVPSSMPAPAGPSALRIGANGLAPTVDGEYLGARLDEWVMGAKMGAPFDATDVAQLYNQGSLARPSTNTNPPDHWWRFEQHVDDVLGGVTAQAVGSAPFFSSDVP